MKRACRVRVGSNVINAGRAGVIDVGWKTACGNPVCDPALVVCFEHAEKQALLLVIQGLRRELRAARSVVR